MWNTGQLCNIYSGRVKENEITQVADWICDVLEDINNEQVISDVKDKVVELCTRFPVYSD